LSLPAVQRAQHRFADQRTSRQAQRDGIIGEEFNKSDFHANVIDLFSASNKIADAESYRQRTRCVRDFIIECCYHLLTTLMLQ
jgi:hypothetical protein